jgi:bifunctional DNA-binding transcriptional regulator/antitoxin component of YhaV-PrlF toxin-antitoxin module
MSVERFVMALGADGTLAIPAELRRSLDLDQPGTLVEVSLDESKTALQMRRYGVMDPDQAWYWTPEWQAKEREADEAYARGDFQRFDSDEEFLAALQSLVGAEDDDADDGTTDREGGNPRTAS